MIDDLQDDFVSYSDSKPGKNQEGKRRLAMFVLVFGIWLVFSAVIILISLPKIKDAVERTNLIEILRNFDDYKKKQDTVDVALFFVNPLGESPKLEMTTKKVATTGETVFHDAIEGLLKGPSDEALKKGSLSFINEKTKLLGLTESCSTVFVNFSKEFLNINDNWGVEGFELAKQQVAMTIKKADSSIKEVVFLVEGTEI